MTAQVDSASRTGSARKARRARMLDQDERRDKRFPRGFRPRRESWSAAVAGDPGTAKASEHRGIDQEAPERLDEGHVDRCQPGRGLDVDAPASGATPRTGRHGRWCCGSPTAIRRPAGRAGGIPLLSCRARRQSGPASPRSRAADTTLQRRRDRAGPHPNTRPSHSRRATRVRVTGVARRRPPSGIRALMSLSVRDVPPPGRSMALTSWRGTSSRRECASRGRARNSASGTRTVILGPLPRVRPQARRRRGASVARGATTPAR